MLVETKLESVEQRRCSECARPCRARTECCKVPSAIVGYLVLYLHCIYIVSKLYLYLRGYTLFFVVDCPVSWFLSTRAQPGSAVMWCMSSDNQAQHTANSGQTKECQQPASDNCRENWTLISAHLSSLLRKSATWDNPTNIRETFNQIKVKEGAPWPWCQRDISIIYYLLVPDCVIYRYLEEKCSPAEVMLSPGLTDEMIP